jgi:heme exporter protein D
LKKHWYEKSVYQCFFIAFNQEGVYRGYVLAAVSLNVVSLVVVHSIIKKIRTLHNAHKRRGSALTIKEYFNQGRRVLSNVKDKSGTR